LNWEGHAALPRSLKPDLCPNFLGKFLYLQKFSFYRIFPESASYKRIYDSIKSITSSMVPALFFFLVLASHR
jgi:hypothetical protein